MLADLRIEQFAQMRLEALVRAFLIGAHQTRIARHIGGEDRGKAAGRGRRGHCSSGANSRSEFNLFREGTRLFDASHGEPAASVTPPALQPCVTLAHPGRRRPIAASANRCSS
jgi:hypothetical protein